MFIPSPRKNKIVLSDYPYRRDIENRLLLAELNTAEVALMKELLDHSLVIPLDHLREALDLPTSTITAILDKFAPSNLCKRENGTVFLDKEMRRYYSYQIAKFDEHFAAGIDFLQGILSKVSPFVLPKWYALPRDCEQVFPTIVDKYLANPKTYQRYLEELHFDQQPPGKIMEAVFASPDLKVDAFSLKKVLQLTPEQFHESILLLEFHLACCLGYERSGDQWREIVTPFHEWRQYLLFQRDTRAKPIADLASLQRTHPRDFGFVEDLALLLQTLQARPIPVYTHGKGWTLPPFERASLFPHQPSLAYAKSLIDKALLLHLADILQGQLILLHAAEEWLQMGICDQALSMTRHPIQVEKGLKRVLDCGWVYVDDFMRGFTGVLHGKEPVALKNKGKRWKYVLPTYTDEERALIETTLCHRLFEAGIVSTGMHEGKACFCVTPFGVSMFE